MTVCLNGERFLMIDAEPGEVLRGNTDDGHVPDRDDLQPGLTCLSLLRRQFATHIAEDFGNLFPCRGDVLLAVADHFGVFDLFVKRAHFESKRSFD